LNKVKNIPASEQSVEILNIELNNLPKDANERSIKSMYFKDAHIIDSVPEIDNITGKCSGKAKIKLRTQNGLRSDALLKSLYTKGAKFQVKNQIKQSDMSNHGNSRSYNKNNSNNQPYVFKNEWLNMHQNFIE
tara:strand:+ start:130 stop:528 length:399 start_codon:yes stop_codon:yes gene_type:complete